MSAKRWVMRSQWESAHNPGYSWHKCAYCGSATITKDETAHRAGACPLCGTTQCNDHGNCQVCLYGWLDGWRPSYSGECTYKNCHEPAIGTARKRPMCRSHIEGVKVTGFGTRLTIAEYVVRAIAHRDSGKGWEHWMEVSNG